MPGHWEWVKDKVKKRARKTYRKYVRWNESSPRRKMVGTYKRAFRHARSGGPMNYYRRKLQRMLPRYGVGSAGRSIAKGMYRFARRRTSVTYPAVGFRSVPRSRGDWRGSRTYRAARWFGSRVKRYGNRAGRWYYNDPRPRTRTRRRRYY